MKTSEAVTPMPGLVIPFAAFTVLYIFLGAVVVSLLYRQVIRTAVARPRPQPPPDENGLTAP
jgi:cytochrome d ubiquinol oxidase subunit I